MLFMLFDKAIDGTEILINMATVRAIAPDPNDSSGTCILRFIEQGDDVRVSRNFHALRRELLLAVERQV